jgi:cytochrome c biogenesis protein ResB
MKRIWSFLSSTELTIALAALICVDAAIGSLLAMAKPSFYRRLDAEVLIPALYRLGLESLGLTAWIYALMILVALFSLNTAACTADRLYGIKKGEYKLHALYPQIVHVGFLIAVLGHLVGSTMGFRLPYNFIAEGEAIDVKEAGLLVRLDGVEMEATPSGEVTSLKSKVTLLKDGQDVASGDIEINSPLIYDGVALYHADQGLTPAGLILSIRGKRYEAAFGKKASIDSGETFTLGRIYPDFALSSDGRPYSRSEDYSNPYIEITDAKGGKGFLPLGAPGSGIRIGDTDVIIADYLLTRYAVLIINKDPGIWLIIAGSAILTLGMTLIFIFRRGKAELVSASPSHPAGGR